MKRGKSCYSDATKSREPDGVEEIGSCSQIINETREPDDHGIDHSINETREPDDDGVEEIGPCSQIINETSEPEDHGIEEIGPCSQSINETREPDGHSIVESINETRDLDEVNMENVDDMMLVLRAAYEKISTNKFCAPLRDFLVETMTKGATLNSVLCITPSPEQTETHFQNVKMQFNDFANDYTEAKERADAADTMRPTKVLKRSATVTTSTSDAEDTS